MLMEWAHGDRKKTAHQQLNDNLGEIILVFSLGDRTSGHGHVVNKVAGIDNLF